MNFIGSCVNLITRHLYFAVAMFTGILILGTRLSSKSVSGSPMATHSIAMALNETQIVSGSVSVSTSSSVSASVSPSNSASVSQSFSASASTSVSASVSASNSASLSASVSPSISASVSASVSCYTSANVSHTPNPYTGAPTTSLLPACYSPPGDSCDWYRNCLEKRYPCKHTSFAYAISYAEKFCGLFGERYSLFSSDGQKWVDAVRKCLQVSLVPLLRPCYKLSCEEIRQRAIASHTPCYINPDKGAPSICDLSCADYLKIFSTIKGSLLTKDAGWESMKGIWNIASECIRASHISNCFKEGKDWVTKGAMKIIKTVIQRSKKLLNRDKRSSDLRPGANVPLQGHFFVSGVGSAIAGALNWNTDVMDWIAYSENVAHVNDPDILHIVIILVDLKALGIVTSTTLSINLNQTIRVFATAIKEGTLPLQVDGYNVWVKSLASCSDKSCNSTQTLAISEKPFKWNTAASISHGNFGLFGFTAVLFMFINKLFL